MEIWIKCLVNSLYRLSVAAAMTRPVDPFTGICNNMYINCLFSISLCTLTVLFNETIQIWISQSLLPHCFYIMYFKSFEFSLCLFRWFLVVFGLKPWLNIIKNFNSYYSENPKLLIIKLVIMMKLGDYWPLPTTYNNAMYYVYHYIHCFPKCEQAEYKWCQKKKYIGKTQ